ncbi:UDP-GlcNAc:undecaprenyl-phosphate GlcNAc-1-phosphate transferase [Jatrophihabitans endophyticus]|uniref:UDP-GlcNAc:undecaprenyl-phosphate GlcNAc-1-phosphate transferase n=1 Tax=Jatrophihabitans endophyticus TaxID=1206085 RepID=A0A1M5DJZ6_9ACTN|nr:MraY family glycosyltransferase [Jatrophihabitans endophyticus]SHF67348.1 UDP-GlcNAc:undecaprenyl-phosphate GlcNAc-1-phosphate transferase [Jatrophihabitans endophyticus]
MPTHPSLEYVLVGCVAAVVTFLLTPVARRVAIRCGALAMPRDRDVHAVATPRMGGVAIFAGLALAFFVAARLPTLHQAFEAGPVMPWVIGSAAIICLLGVIDDRWELDSLTKLAGQVLATGLMVTLGGVQLGAVPIPWGDSGTFVLGQDLSVPVTILLTLVTINALNFIDGLDGLAAGVSAISASAFALFSFHVTQQGFQTAGAAPTLLAAGLAGACVGFLPHNFWPAKVFMGDSGSMLVGMILSASAVSATNTADPQVFTKTSFGGLALLLPLFVPLSILALPFVDLLLAVVRRVRRGRSPFAPDKQHLHHRLLEMGHSHRRAVLLLYFWSALIAFTGVALSYAEGRVLVLTGLAVLVVLGLFVSLVPARRFRSSRRRDRRRPPARV